MQTTQRLTQQRFDKIVAAKLHDYGILTKVRLNLTVVFSALIGYLLAVGGGASLLSLLWLSIAGFAVTGSANAINQLLEKDFDRLMKRTANRPLAAGRMGLTEAILVAGIMGVGGILMLWYCFNDMAALVGALSLLSYAFIYTPLKRIHPVAIFVGAFPGALPPVIGWVAATSIFGYEALVLFCIQFLWQFPHFWAIGWLGAEEYEKAGFNLYPTTKDRNKYTALQIIVYILGLITVSLLPYLLRMASVVYVVTALILGLFFLYFGIRLFRRCDNKSALQLMFSSIIYLPLLQIVMVIDRLFLC